MALGAIVLAAQMALTPSVAVDQARAMVMAGVGQSGDLQFRDVSLKALGPDLIFCGKVNVRSGDGSLTGWRPVLVVASGNPNGRALLTGDTSAGRGIIGESCGHGRQIDDRDYSAALSAH